MTARENVFGSLPLQRHNAIVYPKPKPLLVDIDFSSGLSPIVISRRLAPIFGEGVFIDSAHTSMSTSEISSAINFPISSFYSFFDSYLSHP